MMQQDGRIIEERKDPPVQIKLFGRTYAVKGLIIGLVSILTAVNLVSGHVNRALERRDERRENLKTIAQLARTDTLLVRKTDVLEENQDSMRVDLRALRNVECVRLSRKDALFAGIDCTEVYRRMNGRVNGGH